MSCRIAVIIDQSGSMDHRDASDESTYLQYAQSDATTFINVMVTGDSLGVVSFSDEATIVFGEKTSLIPIKGQQTQDAAQTKIDALTTLNMTNMMAAFNAAAAMMPGEHGIHDAQVFLSDGYNNRGQNPVGAVNVTPLIYTIALGPASNTEMLRQIAESTQVVSIVDGKKVVKRGRYHFAPNGHQLADIYNTIASEAGVAALAATGPTKVRGKSQLTSATVPSGATQATFAVNWDKRAVLLTTKTPVGNQVNLSFYDPHGEQIVTPPAATGRGFAVFKVPNPAAGEYSVDVWYCGEGTLPCTVAVFDNNSNIIAEMAEPQEALAAGSPATIDFRLADGGDPIDGARIEVSLESPLVTLAEAGAAHAARLHEVSVPDDIPEEHQTAAKLARLLRETGEDLLPRALRQITAQPMSGGLYRVQIPSLEKAGSHTVRVVAHGYSAKSNTQFQRTTRLSFITSPS